MGGKAPKGPTQAEMDAQMRRNEEFQMRQFNLQQQYQLEAEQRMRDERERLRISEELSRQRAAEEKRVRLTREEQQETAMFQEMTAQSKKPTSDEFGGGSNLAMPTIERPGYETENRPI
jgi:hypothetical protein